MIAAVFILAGSFCALFFAKKIPQRLFLSWHEECTDYLREPIIYQPPSRTKQFIIVLLFLLLGALIYWRFHDHLFSFISALIFTWILFVASVVDTDYKILPDQLTLMLLWLGLIVNCFSLFSPLSSAVFGAVTGYLFLFITYHAYRLIAKKEGLGHGDFKLLAAIGAWLGVPAIPITLLIASLLACVVIGINILFFNANHQKPFPFGPFLALAGWLIFAGKPLLIHFFPFFM